MIVSAGLALGATSASDALAATGSISGTVTDFATGEPIEGIEVCAQPTNWYWAPGEMEGHPGDCTHTAADGTYSMSDLESENPDHTVIYYEVKFSTNEKREEVEVYYAQYYDEKVLNKEQPDGVAVNSGPVTGIDARMKSPAWIEGTVSEAVTGRPVEGVLACLYWAEGEGIRCNRSAHDGSYALPAEVEGEYEIEFYPPQESPGLALQFYDQQARWEGAEVLNVGLGETITGIDASLHPGGAIAGQVTKAINGQPTEGIQVCAIDAGDDQIWTCSWTNQQGDYELFSLSEGPYRVVFSPAVGEWEGLESWNDGFPTQFWNDQTTLAAADVISLGHETVTGIDAGLGPAPPKPAASPIPPLTSPAAPESTHRRKCAHGRKARMVGGHIRCVKRHPDKHKRRTHRKGR